MITVAGNRLVATIVLALMALLLAFQFRADILNVIVMARVLTPMAEPGINHGVVNCSDIPTQRRWIILVLGQSNAANHGTVAQLTIASGVYTFFFGQCLKASDPMPGASGNGASFMPRLGNQLLRRGLVDSVMFVPLAIESTSISEWATHPLLVQRLHDTAQHLRRKGIAVTHVLWQQGEADAMSDTTSAVYKAGFFAVRERIRASGIHAPIYVAQSSYCKGRHNPTLHAVLAELPSIADNIHRGPDTDKLDAPELRVNGCHFSARGLDRVATMWADILSQ
jgi:hypothetical protein